ncbi:MAG: hypothetical protein SVZ03_10395 [Spirochaetota bacterium]|nr:hypothetical protein [Spirochaetota bacterium]
MKVVIVIMLSLSLFIAGCVTITGEYTGHYLSDKRHGQGTCIYGNGDKYIGEWKDNKKHGQGILYYVDGGKYVGEWKDDKMHGEGKLYYQDGRIFAGHWENDERLSHGILIWENGDKYIGDFIDDIRHGHGTYIYSEESRWAGNKYIGDWKEDRMHGSGTYYYADGSKYVGQWENGAQHGQGTMLYSNGDKYVGDWNNDNRDGHGTYYYVDGKKYVGQWKNDNMYGDGAYYYLLKSSEENIEELVIAWEKVENAEKYIISRSPSLTGNFTEIGTTNDTTYNDTRTEPGSVYYYKIQALSYTDEVFNQSATINKDLYLRSIIPGWGQYYSGKTTKSYIFAGGFVISGGLLAWSLSNQRSKYQDYNDLHDEADRSAYDKKWDDYEKATYLTWGMVSLLGVVYALNWIDVLFFNEIEFDQEKQLITSAANDSSAYFRFNIFQDEKPINGNGVFFSINVNY